MTFAGTMLANSIGNNRSTSNVKNDFTTSLVMAGTMSLGMMLMGGVCYWYHQHKIQTLSQEWEERRKEERTGRVRAEVKLRSLVKEMSLQQQQVDQAASGKDNHRMMLSCIGIISSPYTKRMGTPRQGSLVPTSRAFIQLEIPTESFMGMEDYSHVWIVFGFHANTNLAAFSKKTKIRPPRAQHKVGQLATRSPHRPNPLGLSLVKFERLDLKTKRLHISGLDLVNGTPVYDVKPCVPWDIPGYTTAKTATNLTPLSILQVPEWVNQDDTIDRVEFTQQAQTDLWERMKENRLAPLYTVHEPNGRQAAEQTLKEILAQDPRSSHKGLKKNQRGSRTETAKNTGNDGLANNVENGVDKDLYKLIFGKTEVAFMVLSWGLQVVAVNPIEFQDEDYVEGIPLISEQANRRA